MSNNDSNNDHPMNFNPGSSEEKVNSSPNRGSHVPSQPGNASQSLYGQANQLRPRSHGLSQSDAMQQHIQNQANLIHQLMPGNLNNPLLFHSLQGSLGNSVIQQQLGDMRLLPEAAALFGTQQGIARGNMNRLPPHHIAASIDPMLLQHAGFLSSLVSNQSIHRGGGQLQESIHPSYAAGVLQLHRQQQRQHQQHQQHHHEYQFQSHQQQDPLLLDDFLHQGRGILLQHLPSFASTTAAPPARAELPVNAAPIRPPTKLTKVRNKNDLNTVARTYGKRGMLEPFPEKLHRLLTEVEATGRGDVISFVQDGKAFAIHKPDKFFHDIVPAYFKQSRLSSFKRQLNLYGFELITGGPSRGGYFHESFQKDKADLCRQIRRRDIKFQSRPKNNRSEMNAPDFYSMPPITSSKAAKERVVHQDDSENDGEDKEDEDDDDEERENFD